MAGVEIVGQEVINNKVATQMWVLLFCDSMSLYQYEGQIMENLEAWDKGVLIKKIKTLPKQFGMIQR